MLIEAATGTRSRPTENIDMERQHHSLSNRDEPILIVDDEPAAVAALRRILLRAGYTNLTGTSNPVAALELVERQRPSLLVLDLYMPGMDGFDVLAHIQALHACAEMPGVLVITAANDRSTRLRVLETGTGDYLIKPYDPDEVLLRVRNLLAFWTRRRLLSSFLDSTPAAMLAEDGAGRCTYINRSALDLLGYKDADAVVGRDVHALIHHSYGDGSPYSRAECPIHETRASGQAAHCEEIIWKADGCALPVEYWAYPLIDGRDRGGTLVTFVDIRRRLESERHLRLSETVFARVDHALIITDAKANIVAVNPAYTRLTGWSQEEVIGLNPRFRQSGRHDKTFYREMWRTLLAEHRWEGELWNLRKDGNCYLEKFSITRVCDARGNTTHFVAAARDLTEARRRAQELELARLNADMSNAAKSRFVASMSHEIRTPLTAITGFAESLMDRNLSASDRAHAVDAIIRGGRHLGRLVDDILDFSKIEAGRVEVERVETPLVDLLRGVAMEGADLARTKGLDFSVTVQTPWPRTIRTDPTRARQILINLVSNAVKFTEQGAVRLHISLDREGALLVCAVEDSGIGIDEHRLSEVFESFTQADVSTARTHGGSGLGLTIARGLARLLGGDLSAQSTPGVGSCFTATLDTGPLSDALLEQTPPDLAVSGPATDESDSAPLPTLSGQVLLAEDNPDNRNLITYYLERAGARVSVVENGRDALELAQRTPFDLILMDMRMPIMDGLDATRLLRLSGFDGPIIALTANTTESDRTAALAAGCDDFLTKPIQRGRFHTVLVRYLLECASAGAASDASAIPIADDARYRTLRKKFLDTLPGRLQAMQQAMTRHDLVALAALAHQLKGVAGSFGMPEATQVAGDIETRARAADNAGAADALHMLEVICRMD